MLDSLAHLVWVLYRVLSLPAGALGTNQSNKIKVHGPLALNFMIIKLNVSFPFDLQHCLSTLCFYCPHFIRHILKQRGGTGTIIKNQLI